MKHAFLTALFLLPAFAGCQSLPAPLETEQYGAIETASADWAEAYNANDWDALASFYTSDAILMPPHDNAVTGHADIAAWHSENDSGNRIALDIEHIGGSGDTAYVRGRSCLFVPAGDDTYGVDVGKYIEVRKLQDNGDWLIDVDIFNSDLPEGSGLLDACPFADG